MRAYDQGSLVRVTMTADEVDYFKSRWPCSGLPSRAFWCILEKRNGDLVDIHQRFDGEAASAIVDDCKHYARSKFLDFDPVTQAAAGRIPSKS